MNVVEFKEETDHSFRVFVSTRDKRFFVSIFEKSEYSKRFNIYGSKLVLIYIMKLLGVRLCYILGIVWG